MNTEYGFPSEIWWPDIAHFADNFLDYVNSQEKNEPKISIEQNKMERVRGAYARNLKMFKRKIYGKEASNNRIDRHKIIALYIKSFLEVSPFHIENRKNLRRTIIHNCPNELFSMELMHLMLLSWNEKKCEILMTEHEKDWFVKLLNHFKLEINALDVLSLAQIIYYIEDKHIK